MEEEFYKEIDDFYEELKSNLLVHPFIGVLNRDVKPEECYFYNDNIKTIFKKGMFVFKYKCRFSDSVHLNSVDKVSLFSNNDATLLIEIPKSAIDWNYERDEYKNIFLKYSALTSLGPVLYEGMYNIENINGIDNILKFP